LSNASRKYGIGFWKFGSGIIHTVILKSYGVGVEKFKIPSLLTPGSEQNRATAETDGIITVELSMASTSPTSPGP
jgi:aconitase A